MAFGESRRKKKQLRLSNDHFDEDVCRFEGLPQHGHDNNDNIVEKIISYAIFYQLVI